MDAPLRSAKVSFARRRVLLCGAAGTLLAASGALALARRPGTLDSSFGHHGTAKAGADSRLFGAVTQRDGKVVAVGESGARSSARLLLVRFTSAGKLDRSFGHGGRVIGPAIPGAHDKGSLGRAVALQSDGKIVVVGKATNGNGAARDGLLIERYDSRGRLDHGFGRAGIVEVLTHTSYGDGYAVAIQPNGGIVAAGTSDRSGAGGVVPRTAVVRVKPNGSLDSSFGQRGISTLDLGAYSYALAVALQRNGRIVLAGSTAPGFQVPQAIVARLTRSGALDPSFAHRGQFTRQYARHASDSSFNAVAIQRDGRIVAAGSAADGNSGGDAIVARITGSGGQDNSFGSGGVVYSTSATNFLASGTSIPGASGVALGPGGRIIAAGESANSVETKAAVWAFTARGGLDRTFGSKGKVLTTYNRAAASEATGVAIASNGAVVTAGDGQAIPGRGYFAIVARYVGF